jgi:hypothetical protein
MPDGKSETTAERARKTVLAVEIDEAELACRILEAQVEMRRPHGMSAREALETQTPQLQADVRRAAVAAIRYLTECVNRGRRCREQ